ncbi:MAG: preprotein translocase subunit YajC [Planctomycetaceae bacterium]
MPPLPLPPVAALLLAQAQGEPASPAQVLMQVLPLVLIGAAAWMLLIKPERERMRKQQEVLSGLKKNDRVLTTAGIYGTVANVDRDAGRVTLRIDETANVKIQVAISSIASVLEGAGDPSPGAG